MELWKKFPFDRSLSTESPYCILVNAVVYEHFKSRGEIGQLFRQNNVFEHYDAPNTVLNQDVLTVVLTFFNDGTVDYWRLLKEEAVSAHFVPYPENCSPSIFWDWFVDFKHFKEVKQVVEDARLTEDPIYSGYNFLDELFVSLCSEKFKRRVKFPQRSLPTWLLRKIERVQNVFLCGATFNF